MKMIELSDVAALSPHLESTSAEPVMVRSHGKTLAAVVPVNDDDVESLLLSINPRFQRIMERSEERLQAEGSLSTEEVRRRLAESET